ncbi:hypothetical protein Q7C36_005988 [Tachysurus vachellii]|uniref:Uncharacterized protein n=1 Tax=Tachysurus vachellii TaxID=175792 RepID=A0AA88NIP7_TACVA|nr:hypothetical protein Q7C36_005988 [Tachysurus vachellii]
MTELSRSDRSGTQRMTGICASLMPGHANSSFAHPCQCFSARWLLPCSPAHQRTKGFQTQKQSEKQEGGLAWSLEALCCSGLGGHPALIL